MFEETGDLNMVLGYKDRNRENALRKLCLLIWKGYRTNEDKYKRVLMQFISNLIKYTRQNIFFK